MTKNLTEYQKKKKNYAQLQIEYSKINMYQYYKAATIIMLHGFGAAAVICDNTTTMYDRGKNNSRKNVIYFIHYT